MIPKAAIVTFELENLKLLLVLEQAERCGSECLIISTPEEGERGMLRVKGLAAQEEQDMAFDALFQASD